MHKKNSTVITRNTNCRNPETDGFFVAYSGCFCFSKRDNFVFTSSSVEGEAFMAMVGARCTGWLVRPQCALLCQLYLRLDVALCLLGAKANEGTV